MKEMITAIFILGSYFLISLTGYAQTLHHAKHNMVLFGESEIFVSHIVYKVPHNYQVILKIELQRKIKDLYLKEKSLHSTDEFIFLLDQMNIKDIASVPMISGTILRTDQSGGKIEIAKTVEIDRAHFKVLYFDELPLSLEAN